MANKLKFGNGEWYGKEGFILAYNDEGGNYKPLPFNFSCSSTRTAINKEGLIKTVGLDQPRVDYKDSTKGAMLLERTSTNYIRYSEDFSQSYWSKQGTSSITSNTTISPNGSLDADTLSGATGTGVSDSVLRVNVGLSEESTLSIYCKSLGSTNLTIYIRDGSNGSIGSESITLTDDWQRVVLTKDPNNGQVFFGNTNGDVAIWGAQLEQQSYATSYIPNYGNAAGVTRLADDANSTGDLSSLVDSYPFSMYVHSKYVGGNRFALTFSNTSSDNQYYTISVVSDEVRLDARANGNSELIQSGITLNEGDEFKAAIVMESDTVGKICVNGGSVVNKNDFSQQSINASIKYLMIGRLRIISDTGDRLPVFEARLYDEALSDTELQKLTTL